MKNEENYSAEEDTKELIQSSKLPEPLHLAAMLEQTLQSPLHGKAADCLRRMYAQAQAAQPVPEQYAALEQALARLQKRYGALESMLAANPATEKSSAVQQEPVQEPVAWLQIGLAPFHDGDVIARTTKPKAWNPEWWRFEPLYITPPAAQRLTAREIELIDGMIEVQLDHAQRCDSIANRTMAEKQKSWDMERVALLQKLKDRNT